jgi:hypothetical protein
LRNTDWWNFNITGTFQKEVTMMKCKKCGKKVDRGISAFIRSACQCEGCGAVICNQCIENKNSFNKSGDCPFCGAKAKMMR